LQYLPIAPNLNKQAIRGFCQASNTQPDTLEEFHHYEIRLLQTLGKKLSANQRILSIKTPFYTLKCL